MLDFCTLAMELLKYQSHLVAQNVLVTAEWDYTNHYRDAIILGRPTQKYQFKITREIWDRSFEFVLKTSDLPEVEHHYRVDILSLVPVQVIKPVPLRLFHTNTVAGFELQDFGREIYRLILELTQNHLNIKNQYYQALASLN